MEQVTNVHSTELEYQPKPGCRIFAQLSPLMWANPFPVPSGCGHCDNSGCIQIASVSGAARLLEPVPFAVPYSQLTSKERPHISRRYVSKPRVLSVFCLKSIDDDCQRA